MDISVGIAKSIEEDWQSDYCDFGAVEGRFEAIPDSAGGFKIQVRDFLYSRAIDCVVPESLIHKVLDTFRRRVEIEGRIHYRRDGAPVRIEAEEIQELPEDDELPTADDVRGIMAGA